MVTSVGGACISLVGKQSGGVGGVEEGVEWRFGTSGLRMLAVIWAGIPVEVTQQADVVQRCRRAAIRIPF